MKKILYISTLLPESFSDNRIKTMIQYSADNMSSVFLEGFMYQEDICVDVINVQPISAWPKQSEHFFIKRSFFKRCDVKITNASFINITGIRQFSKYQGLKYAFKRIRKDKYDAVIAYSVSTPILMFLKYFKKSENTKTCLIVPDLPSFMMRNSDNLYRKLKNLDVRYQKRLYDYVDNYILFSENMKDYFNIEDNQYIVIEGAISKKIIESIKVEEREKRQKCLIKLMYSGQIEFSNGIRELVEVANDLESNVELIIIGGGRATDYVIGESKKNKQIRYLGTLSHEKVIEWQKKADILVNPRPPLEFTKYSFPSKTLEYLLSGNPVVMQRLGGIPKEYDEFINYCTFKDMKDVIDNIIDNYLIFKNKAEFGKKYVVKEKNCDKVARRILDYIF